MIDALLALLAPHHCYICQEIGAQLCDNCKYDIISEPYNHCVMCHAPVGSEALCSTCKGPYSRAWCVSNREGAIRSLIDDLKFSRTRSSAKTMADLLDATIPQLQEDVILVPIPTIPSHIRQRGYDHTLLIAKEFARHRKFGQPQQLLKRKSYTVQRHASSRRQRVQWAKQAFEVSVQLDPNKTYLIIDDVMTSGATMWYAAKAFRQAGAISVWVAVVAHQVSTE